MRREPQEDELYKKQMVSRALGSPSVLILFCNESTYISKIIGNSQGIHITFIRYSGFHFDRPFPTE